MRPLDVTNPDPLVGASIGRNEIIARLSPQTFVARRSDELVVLTAVDVAPAAADRLRQQASALTGVTHPHLARVHPCEVEDEGVFWVTELVPGATLTELLSACKKTGRSLSTRLIFAAVHEAALALGELHRNGRAHGEVNCDQLMVTFSGTLKLLSGAGRDPRRTSFDAHPCDDARALAEVLYQCLVGLRPVHGAVAPPSSFNRTLDPAVDALLSSALSGRYRNGTELAQAIRSAAAVWFARPEHRAAQVRELFADRWERSQSWFTALAVAA